MGNNRPQLNPSNSRWLWVSATCIAASFMLRSCLFRQAAFRLFSLADLQLEMSIATQKSVSFGFNLAIANAFAFPFPVAISDSFQVLPFNLPAFATGSKSFRVRECKICTLGKPWDKCILGQARSLPMKHIRVIKPLQVDNCYS